MMKTYTHKTVNDTLIPRENYIKNSIDFFNKNHPILKKTDVEIGIFHGKYLENESNEIHQYLAVIDHEKDNYNELMNLPIFNLLEKHDLEHLTQGRYMTSDKSYVERIFYLKHHNQQDFLGAIYIVIDLKKSHISISSFGIKKTERRQGFGTVLLNFAVVLAGMYGIQKISLNPVNSSVSFYLKYDFYYQPDDKDPNKKSRDSKFIKEQNSDDNIFVCLHLDIQKSFDYLKQQGFLLDTISASSLEENEVVLKKQKIEEDYTNPVNSFTFFSGLFPELLETDNVDFLNLEPQNDEIMKPKNVW